MLVTRVDRWSLTDCRCLGIKIHSQKFRVKSEELVVERSLKLDALNLNWLGVIDGPPLHGQFRKNTFKPCTPTMKKNCEKRGAFLAYWRLINLLSFEKELGWGQSLVQHTIFGN